MATPCTTNEGQRREQQDGQLDQRDEPSNVEHKQERGLPDSWIKAHLQTCRHHQSLSATPLQVAQFYPEAVCLWEHPSLQDVVVLAEDSHTGDGKVEAGAVAQAWKEQNEIQQQQQQQSSSSWITTATRTAKHMTQTILRHLYRVIDEEPDDSDYDEWKAEDDNAIYMFDDIDDSSQKLDFNQNVLSVDLTIECCKQLLQQQQASDGVAVAMYMDERSDDAPCLMRWCHKMGRQDCNKEDDDIVVSRILEKINRYEAHILAHVLVNTGHAVFGNDEQTILVVHGGSSIETHVDVEVAKLELSTAQLATERQIQQWTVQADTAGKRALLAKKSGGAKSQKKALMEMKTRQLLLEKIETSRNVVLNLEMAYHALEQTQSQQQVMASLKTSSTTLQTLRQNSTHSDDVSVLDNFQDELEELRTLQETLATEQQHQIVVDEEELLQELEELSISSSSPSPDKKKPVASEQNDTVAETTKESNNARLQPTQSDDESHVEATKKQAAAVKVAPHT